MSKWPSRAKADSGSVVVIPDAASYQRLMDENETLDASAAIRRGLEASPGWQAKDVCPEFRCNPGLKGITPLAYGDL